MLSSRCVWGRHADSAQLAMVKISTKEWSPNATVTGRVAAELGPIVYLPGGGSSWRGKRDFDYQRFVHLYFQLSIIHFLSPKIYIAEDFRRLVQDHLPDRIGLVGSSDHSTRNDRPVLLRTRNPRLMRLTLVK